MGNAFDELAERRGMTQEIRACPMSDEEKNLIEDFRSLRQESRRCLLAFMEASVQASSITGTVIDMRSFITPKS